jgi:hypothetical protein
MTLNQFTFEGLGAAAYSPSGRTAVQGPADGDTISNTNSGSSTSSMGGGTHTFRTAMAAHGSFGYQVVNASGVGSYRRWNFAAATTEWQASVVVTLPSAWPLQNTSIYAFPNAGGTGRFGISLTATGGLFVQDVGSAHTATIITGGTLSLGGKYRIVTQAVGGSTTASQVTIKVYSNTGSGWTNQVGSTYTASNWNMGTDQAVGIDLGVNSSPGAIVLTMGFDDIQINDGTGSEIGDYVYVNVPPTVDAGANQNVSSGATVSLSATASDSDGNIASHEWSFDYPSNGAPALTGGNTATPSFTAGSAGSLYILRDTVTDNGGATASDTVEVRVPTNTVLAPLPGAGTGAGTWTNVGGAASEGAALADSNDATYVESAAVSASEQNRRFRLTPSQTRTSGTITVRVAQDTAGALVGKVRLYEGTTMRQEWTITVTTSIADQTCTLSGATVSAITDWSNLFVEVAAANA